MVVLPGRSVLISLPRKIMGKIEDVSAYFTDA